jgi:hypothetical protein
MGEYMIKNFEAMACGCVLFAFNQGESENQALGFIDMENISCSIATLPNYAANSISCAAAPETAHQIAQSGRALAESSYSFSQLGQEIVKAMTPPLRPHPAPGWLATLRNRWGI